MTTKEILQLENSVANTGSQLYMVATKLSAVERCLDNTSFDDVDDVCMMELLDSMTEVKNEYQNLRKDIQEVQQLQKDVSSSIRFQMKTMHQTFKMLKKRIEVRTAEN